MEHGARKKKILLVDDEEDILESLSVILRRNGYIVSVAETGQDALGIVEKEPFDLIILDLMLPDIEGSDVAAKLAEQKVDIPIIFLTSLYTKLEQKTSGEMVANRCIIAKPCKADEILRVVREQIGPAA